jgi:ribosomal protein L33
MNNKKNLPNLKTFDPMLMHKDRSITVAIGHRNTGKTELARQLFLHKPHLPMMCAYVPTDHDLYSYKWIPPILIHTKSEDSMLKHLFRWTDKKEQQIPTGVILDQVNYVTKKSNKEYYDRLFLNKSDPFCTYMCFLYAYGMPSEYREQIDYLFISRDNIPANRRRIYESYLTRLHHVLPTFEFFSDLMDAHQDEYGFLVFWFHPPFPQSYHSSIQEYVFTYRPHIRIPDHDHFRMCSDEIWSMCLKKEKKCV